MGCCDDPTEPEKISRADLIRVQEQYGNLERELFTSDPEQVMLRQLRISNTYIKELAALRAHFPTVRMRAIELLEQDSVKILQRIVDTEEHSDIGQLAKRRIEELAEKSPRLLKNIFGN